MSENTSANPNNNDGLAQPNPATQADSSPESAQYNHGPQQVVSAKEHAQQVAIQALLAALPEMFPGVQKIPLANIRLNPNNPGAKAAEEDIAELAANIALVGLKNAAKVMPDPAGPLAPGLSPHPDNFRLKADNTPWTLSDFRFLNLSGELRQLACQRLQWTVMDGLILNPTPEEAVEITDLDNAVRDKGWWAKYQSIENLIKANPNLKQREIATRLRIDKEQVNWALRLLPLLNTEARGVLVRNPYKPSKGNKGISESAAARLTALGPGTGLKRGGGPNDPPQAAGSSSDPAQANLEPPLSGKGRLVASAQLLYPYRPIPPETQDLVYRTLVVARDHQMKEAQVQKLVEWVQVGNPPETFGSTPHTPKAKKAPGITPETLAKALELAEQVGVAKGRGEDPKPAQDLLNAHLAEIKTTPISGTTEPEPTVKVVTLLGQSLKALFKPGTPTPNDLPPRHQDTKDTVVSDSNGTKVAPTAQGSKPFQIDLKASDPRPPAEEHALSVPISIKKEIGAVIHWFKKIPEKITKKTWREIFKIEHRLCKWVAKLAVPEHYTHSGQTRSGHQGSSRGLGKDLTTLALTLLHWAVYGVCQFVFWWGLVMWTTSRLVPGLRPWFEWPFRFAAQQMLAIPTSAWAWGSSHLFPAAVIVVIALVLISKAAKVEPMRMWLLGICLAAGLYYGHRWAYTNADMALAQPKLAPQPVASAQVPTPIADVVKKIVSLSNSIQKPKPTPVPKPAMVANGNIDGPLAQPSHVSQLVASQQVYQPSIAFNTPASTSDSSGVTTLYDPKLLEQEIKAVRDKGRITAFAVLPDEGMTGDLAVSRTQEATDPDKYTLIIDGDKKKIINLATNTTNLVINFKSADPLNIFGGSDGVTVFYEDVLYIHTDEINVETKIPYRYFQLTLVGASAKNALTFQCDSADDLKHLVSGLEYFIRNSRLGRDTALAGMPYLLQGLRLDRDLVVLKLWTSSPADRAGLQLGDHLWSIGKATKDQQEKKDFEKVLSSSTSVTLFVASDSDWTKAKIAASEQSNEIHPKLRKVSLGL